MDKVKPKPYPARLRDSNYFAIEALKGMRKKFTPSYEKERKQTNMGTLLGWGYGNTYLEERDEFIKDRHVKTSPPKRYDNDFSDWLKKRNPEKKIIKFR